MPPLARVDGVHARPANLSLPGTIRAHRPARSFFFFFNDTATTEIYTLSLHDALPISSGTRLRTGRSFAEAQDELSDSIASINLSTVRDRVGKRSEEHTSELQSQSNLVCRLLLEKKKNVGFCSIRFRYATSRTRRRRAR